MPDMPDLSDSDAPQRIRAGSSKQVLVTMCVALALVVSSVSSLNMALPNLAENTGATQTQQLWIVDAYALVFAGLLFLAGALGDKYGRRRTLLIGLAVFGGAHAFGAFVDDPGLLISARAIAGIGSALIMPSTLSLITTTFPAEERAKAVGTWAGVASGGAVLGLLLSGSLLEVTDWQWIFAGNALWAAFAVVLGFRFAPDTRDADQPPLDYVGAVLSAVGLAALIFSTIEGPERGWSDGLVLSGFAVGTLLLALFILWELRARYPLLDPRLFRLTGFQIGSLSMTLQFFALFGFIYGILQYLQLVRGYSPLEAALALLPLAAVVAGLSRKVAPALMGRFGPRQVNAVGLALLAVGFAALSTLDVGSGYPHILGAVLVLASGMGLATTPATTSIVRSLPASKQGVASAMNDTTREVGAAIGIAVLGSILNGGYSDGMADHTAAMPPEAAERAEESLAFVVKAAEEFGPAGEAMVGAARQAFVDGFTTTMWLAAGVMAAGALMVAASVRRSGEPSDAPAEADVQADVPSLATD